MVNNKSSKFYEKGWFKGKVADKRSNSYSNWLESKKRALKHGNRKKSIDNALSSMVQGRTLTAASAAKLDLEHLALPAYTLDMLKEATGESIELYGREIPAQAIIQALYNSEDGSFYWTNKDNELSGFDDSFPSIIFPDGMAAYHKDGLLHRTVGPALNGIEDSNKEFWIMGRNLSELEFDCYDPIKNRIAIKNDDDKLCRSDGPALMEFDNDGGSIDHYYDDGELICSIEVNKEDTVDIEVSNSILEKWMTKTVKVTPRKLKPKVSKVTKITEPQNVFLEISEEEQRTLRAILSKPANRAHLEKFSDEIHEAADKALIQRGIDPEEFYREAREKAKERTLRKAESEEEPKKMNIVNGVRIRSSPDLSGGRVSQVKNGFVFGLKKGVIKNSSKHLSKKLVSMSPLDGNEWAERFVQICILVGLAELFLRMPEGIAKKINMSEEQRRNLASALRYTSGEEIGRDLVDIAANVLPLFGEILKGVTAEELDDLAVNFSMEDEVVEDLTASEESTANMDVEDLFSFAEEEDNVEVKQTVDEEVQV